MFRTLLLLMASATLIGCPAHNAHRCRCPKNGNGNDAARPAAKGVWPGQFPFKVLYMVRHSSTVFNRYSQIGGQIRYDPLDSLGFKERVGIFLMLRNEPIRAIYTSLQRRSQMTARPLAAHLGLKIRPTPALNEFSGGISEGICYSLMGKRPSTEEAVACDQSSDDPLVKRAEKFLRTENRRRFKVGIGYRWPGGGESILDVDKRLDRWLRTLPPELKDQTVAFFGHSGTNRFLLAKLMGWKLLDAARVRQRHTQIWRIERKGSGQLELKMFLNGKWVTCAEPPTMSKGLPCLNRHRRRRKLKKAATRVKDIKRDRPQQVLDKAPPATRRRPGGHKPYK